MRRLGPLVMLVAVGAAACSGGGGAEDTTTAPTPTGALTPRFCDAYLDYIGDASDANLETVIDASDGNPSVVESAEIIRNDPKLRAVLAAGETLEQFARDRCQGEWIGAAQGAGTTAGAAQAFFAAVVSGDELGAANVASSNAIARFEPWTPVVADEELGTPTIGAVEPNSFTMILGPATIAQCRVEVGVVISCVFLE